jgi:hypothetical protein
MPIGASALALLFTLVVACGSANAEVGAPTPTVQAVAADATWLAYTPPPEHPGIVCMVDSGVDPNPDTEAAVIGGQAIAPETDTLDEIAQLEPHVQPGNHPDGHGTLMAMMMAAPINGWGMVGIAPTSVRVYNMKALAKGRTTFPFNNYVTAIDACEQVHVKAYPFMSAINLSLGGTPSPSPSELVGLGNAVIAAQHSGLSVVAAAGNEGGRVLYPAAYPPIVAIGAGDAGSGPGALCVFASRGEGLDVIAPGCDSLTGGLEGAFEDDGSPAYGSGSSQASAIVSAVLASIRAYAPQLTYIRAEECITTTADDGSIDTAAAFDACGLATIVSEGQTAERAASRGSQQGVSQEASKSSAGESEPLGACALSMSCEEASVVSGPGTPLATATMCPRPVLAGVSSRQGYLVLRVHGRPGGCRLQARLLVKQHGRYRWSLTSSVVSKRLRLPNLDPRRIEARFASGATNRNSSPWITASGGFR